MKSWTRLTRRGSISLVCVPILLAAILHAAPATVSLTVGEPGRPATLTAVITPVTAQGSVTFYSGVRILGIRKAAGGTATLGIQGLAPGPHLFHAVYSGDAAHERSASKTQLYRVPATESLSFSDGGTFRIGAQPSAIIAGDFGLAVANSGDGTLTVIAPDGTASVYKTGVQPVAVASADFNGGGTDGFAVANAGDKTITLLFGGRSETLALPAAPASLAIADFNGDGAADLAVTLPERGTVAVLLGNGDGTFGAATEYAAGTDPRAVAVGDFNGDGIPDIATANPLTNSVGVLYGTGTGFAERVAFQAGSNPEFLAADDFNADGRTDLAVASTGSRDIEILLGEANGTLRNIGGYPAKGMPTALAAGEFNASGHEDIVWLDSDAGLNFLAGNGTGQFTPSALSFNATGTALAVMDFNRDGRADMAIAGAAARIVLGSATADVRSDTGTRIRATATADAQSDQSPATVVTTAADDNSPGSLRQILAGATSGTTVTFSSSIAGSTITLTNCPSGVNQQCGITVPAGVSIDGGANHITIDGNKLYRIFVINGNTAIRNLTLQNGRAAGGNGGNGQSGGGGAAGMGGAVFAQGKANTFTNVIFQNNQAVGGNGGWVPDLTQSAGGGGGLGGDGGEPSFPSGFGVFYQSTIGGGGGPGGVLGGNGGNGGVQDTLDLNDVVDALLTLLGGPELKGVAELGRTAFEQYVRSYDWDQVSVNPPTEGGAGAGGGGGGFNVEFGAPGGFGGGGGGASMGGPYYNGARPNPVVAIGGGSEFGGGSGGGDPTDGVGFGGNGYGGAVFVYSGAGVSFSNCQFIGNKAQGGASGLINVDSDGPMAASYGGNTALGYGGAIYIYDGSDSYLPTPGAVYMDPAAPAVFTSNAANVGTDSHGQPWLLTTLNAANTYYVFSAADAGVGSLREAAQYATSGYTILFTPQMAGATVKLTTTPIPFTHGINIDGGTGNITVDGGGKTGIFVLTNGRSVIRNLSLVNGYARGYDGGSGWMGGGGAAGLGGAVAVIGGDVTLSHVVFRNNGAQGGNGAPGDFTGQPNNCLSEYNQIPSDCAAGGGGGGGGLGAPGSSLQANTHGSSSRGVAGGAGGVFGGAGGAGGDPESNSNYLLNLNGGAGGLGAGGGGGGGGDTRLPDNGSCDYGDPTCFLKVGGNGGAGGVGGGGGGSGDELCPESSVAYMKCPGGQRIAPNPFNFSGQTAKGGAGGVGGGGGGGYIPGPGGLFGGAGASANLYQIGIAGGGGGAGLGGAVFFYDGTLTIDTCTFTGNSTNGGGGNLYYQQPDVAGGAHGQGKGGAVFRFGGNLIWTGNSSFSGNAASSAGNSATDNSDIYGDSKNHVPTPAQPGGLPVPTTAIVWPAHSTAWLRAISITMGFPIWRSEPPPDSPITPVLATGSSARR